MSIWNHSSAWSSFSSDSPLYRGFLARTEGEVVTISSPTNRFPVHMPLKVQCEIDDWFENRFSVRFRQRALFSTGSLEVARDYTRDTGEVRVLVPYDSFCFCWSPVCADLYGAYESAKNGTPISELLASLDFKCDDLASAIRSGHEIMLVCACVEATRHTIK